MERFRIILHKLLFPGVLISIGASISAGILLAMVFLGGSVHPALEYMVYVYSAYALTVLCINIWKLVRAGGAAYDDYMESQLSNPHVKRYLGDQTFRMHVSLYMSLAANLLFAGIKMITGIYFHSCWFGAIAAYYVLLSLLRYLLLRHVNRNSVGADIEGEYRSCRLCGALLLVLNLALSGMVVQMIWRNRSYRYPDMLIYAVAAYVFYSFIFAVANLMKFRKYKSPVMSAAKVLNVATAVVSMLTLQTAMLTKFGGEKESFRQTMNTISGVSVCVIILGMAVFMIGKSTGELKKMQVNIGTLTYVTQKEIHHDPRK